MRFNCGTEHCRGGGCGSDCHVVVVSVVAADVDYDDDDGSF